MQSSTATLPTLSKPLPRRLEMFPQKGLCTVAFQPKSLRPCDVEIAPYASFVSAGTELNALRHFIEAKASHTPFCPGYSQSGVVIRVGSDVQNVAPGDRVVAIGAGAFHAERTIVAKNLVHRLPEGVSFEAAAPMAMYCFALEGVYKTKPLIGENAIVFGAGMMGQLTARLLALAGCRVGLMDPSPFRLDFAAAFPVECFPATPEGWAQLRAWSRPYGIEHASISFGGDATETINRLKPLMSCSPDGIPQGKIVFPGGATMSLLMASNMGNIQFLSSAKAGPGYRDPVYESGADYPTAYVPHPVRRNVDTLLELIATGKLKDLEKLISHQFPFAQAQQAYELLQGPSSALPMGVLLMYNNHEQS